MKAIEDAVAASAAVAERFGLRADRPVPLRSTNNVVAWLRPSPVVAKIGRAERRQNIDICVASELSALGAPVVPPAPEIPAVVHSYGDFKITFWRYCPQPADLDIPGADIAMPLLRLHEAYRQLSARLRDALPSYLDELQSVAELLRDAARVPALANDDRQWLLRLFERLWRTLREPRCAARDEVIHGSPHSYNVLLVDGGVRFIDFETTCIGPIEWDLAHTSPDTVRHYVGLVNAQLLESLRNLGRIKTAAWCWADVERGDLRYHAEAHLAYLKRTFARHG